MIGIATPGLVSIIVASYNHAEFLEQRMDSLINQTYQDIEILVIDDCSPDNSVEILRRYESHPKVRLIISEKNSGWVAVSNQGVEMSAGEFVIFANCDDSCDPRMIERLVEGMRANPTAGITYCRSLMIDEGGKQLGDDFLIREKAFRVKCYNDALITKNEMSRFLLHSCVIPNLSAALFRRECYTSAGGLTSDYRVCSDWDLFFKVVVRYDVAYIAAPLNKFRQHKTTIRSSTKDRIIYEEFIRLLLGQIKRLDLTLMERVRFRTRVMYLWAIHLLPPSFGGVSDFYYHLRCVISHDSVALIFLLPAILFRFVTLLIKLPSRLIKWN
ncbi:MAG: glycosyltransferase [Methylotenera sp.]|nr:glycosyltransferase [Methylotenera sp.]MDD4925326.1 glycosyltransferase [Methylotenera sp.]